MGPGPQQVLQFGADRLLAPDFVQLQSACGLMGNTGHEAGGDVGAVGGEALKADDPGRAW